MQIAEFELERWQSHHEHEVDYNLAESGVHPLSAGDLVAGEEVDRLLRLPLVYAQTNGPVELRERIAQRCGASIGNILVTNGTIEANFIAAWWMLEPGDEIAYLTPNYLQIGGLAESFGVRVRPFSLREELGWQPDPDELERAVTPRTKAIVLLNPNNPTGVVLEPAAMDRIVELAGRVGAWLVVDEVYRGTEHDGRLTPSFWGRQERVMVTGSLSKAYGLPGLRIGWIVAPEGVVESLWSRKDYLSITASTLSYELAKIALDPANADLILGRNRQRVIDNLAVLRSWVDSRRGRSLVSPTAAAMALLRYEHAIGSSELSARIHRDRSVLVVPGRHFGLERCLRIGYGLPTDDLRGALRRIDETLDELELPAA